MGTWGPPHPRWPTPWAPGHPCFLGSQSTSHVKTPGQVWGRGHQVGPSLLTHIAPLCTPTGPPEWGPAPQPAPTCIRFCASGFTAPHAAVPRRHPCPEARLPVCCCSVLPGLSCSRVPLQAVFLCATQRDPLRFRPGALRAPWQRTCSPGQGGRQAGWWGLRALGYKTPGSRGQVL